jgi:hypothetical protein
MYPCPKAVLLMVCHVEKILVTSGYHGLPKVVTQFDKEVDVLPEI